MFSKQNHLNIKYLDKQWNKTFNYPAAHRGVLLDVSHIDKNINPLWVERKYVCFKILNTFNSASYFEHKLPSKILDVF